MARMVACTSMSYSRTVELFTLLDVVGICMIAARLVQHGLTKRFKFFAAFLALDLVSLLIGRSAGIGSLAYCHFWIYSQVGGLVLVPLCFREVFQDLYMKHPGLRIYSRSVLLRTLLLGMATACLSLPLSERTFACEWGFDCWLYRVVGLKVFIALGMTFFTPTMALYLKRLDGVHIDRNTAVQAIALTSHIFLGCIGSLLLIFLNSAAVMQTSNLTFLILNLGCQTIWILGLTRYQAPSRRAIDASEERVVFDQLRRMREVVDQMEEKARLLLGRR